MEAARHTDALSAESRDAELFCCTDAQLNVTPRQQKCVSWVASHQWEGGVLARQLPLIHYMQQLPDSVDVWVAGSGHVKCNVRLRLPHCIVLCYLQEHCLQTAREPMCKGRKSIRTIEQHNASTIKYSAKWNRARAVQRYAIQRCSKYCTHQLRKVAVKACLRSIPIG